MKFSKIQSLEAFFPRKIPVDPEVHKLLYCIKFSSSLAENALAAVSGLVNHKIINSHHQLQSHTTPGEQT